MYIQLEFMSSSIFITTLSFSLSLSLCLSLLYRQEDCEG